MEGVRSYVELGGQVSQRQAREILGITEPEDGEPILSSEQQQEGDMMEGMGGGGEGDIMSQLFGGGMPEGGGEEMPPPPNAGEADKAFREFAKNLKKNRAKK